MRGGDFAVFEQRQQRAPPADVDDQRMALIDPQRVTHRLTHGGHGQARFLGRVDDLDVQSCGHEDAIQKRLAVAGLAHGACGHGADHLDLVQVQQPAEIAQHADGGPHALASETAAAKGVLTETHRPLQSFKNFDPPVGKHLGDHHAKRVRADVDGSDDLGRRGVGRRGWIRLHKASFVLN